MVISGLPMGGAETFFVRLARGLSKSNMVVVYLFTRTGCDEWLLSQLDEIRVVYAPLSSPQLYRLLYKISITLQRAFPRLNLADAVRNWGLRRLHRRYRFDVCNPHLTPAERQSCLAFKNDDIPIVGTDNGDYRWVINQRNQDYYKPIFRRSDALVCPSRSNLECAQVYPRPTTFRYHLIYHGHEPSLDSEPKRQDQPDPADPIFTFGMVARGVPEKGWQEAVDAFTAVKRTVSMPLRLILVGSGECLTEIEKRIPADVAASITFAGYQAEPEKYVSRFDVGLLPSYFKAESLPMSIIEYLSHNKPVIATRIGGIEEMLQTQEGTAGVLIGRDAEGRANVDDLKNAMRRLSEDPIFLDECRARAILAFKRFSMEHCVGNYLKTFEEVIALRAMRPNLESSAEVQEPAI